MHIKAVCQHFSGFKRGHYSTTDITRIKSDELHSVNWNHICYLTLLCTLTLFVFCCLSLNIGLAFISAVRLAVDLSEILILSHVAAARE